MGSRRRVDRRLGIHRETLRHLGARHLARVAGGTVMEGDDGLIDGNPRSNVWSGFVSDVDAMGACVRGLP